MNFSKKYCDSSKELLSSMGFKKVLNKYISILEKNDILLVEKLQKLIEDKKLSKTLLELFKVLIILEKHEVKKLNSMYKALLAKEELLIEFIEGFYDYWRSLERYALIQTSSKSEGLQSVNFVEANNNFSNRVLFTYRRIEENILGYKHNVYRQLSAGINAGIVLAENELKLPNAYEKLDNIEFVKSIVLTPPFIIYPKMNKRSGLFEEVFKNPLEEANINITHYFCYPAKVGESLAFIYFHRDFMNHGIALCNLFELAKSEEYLHKKPDLIYVFGQRIKSTEKTTVFYNDKENDIFLGFTSNTEEIDYFGYMKKMILTLHNVRMIQKGALPIHGAMVNVTLKNGKTANIAIMGDSGAGKSESLEAFRKLGSKYLKEIKIIFDDMGIFKIENNKVYGYGTEIGAFVRLDDLETGYAFQEMDRAIFMNPHRTNARLLLPVSTFKDIMRGYKVDIFLYANNYEDKKEVIEVFDNVEDAKEVFVKGYRKAKGTTSEVGIVESYFANPFGGLQKKEENDVLIDKVFNKLFDNKVVVGQIYTKLGLDGYELKGPEKAAKKLFEWLMNK